VRHLAVRRASILVAVAILAAAGLFAWWVREDAPEAAGPPQTTQGAALYEQYCARCHAGDDLGGALRTGGAAKRAEWETFLRDHGRASAAEDRAILDYLARQPGR
jgi:mono/diheme cytochrome c family protein